MIFTSFDDVWIFTLSLSFHFLFKWENRIVSRSQKVLCEGKRDAGVEVGGGKGKLSPGHLHPPL